MILPKAAKKIAEWNLQKLDADKQMRSSLKNQ